MGRGGKERSDQIERQTNTSENVEMRQVSRKKKQKSLKDKQFRTVATAMKKSILIATSDILYYCRNANGLRQKLYVSRQLAYIFIFI